MHQRPPMIRSSLRRRLLVAALASLAAGVSLTAAGCGDGEERGAATTFITTPDPSTSGEPAVTDTRWVLESGVDADGKDLVVDAASPPTLLVKSGGEVEVFGGCNRGGGKAQVTDGLIEFEPIMSTQMACGTTPLTLEATFLEALQGKVAAAFEGDALSLTKGGTRLLFRAG